MDNVYMTPLNYINFNGQKKQTKLQFHITPREFADWMIENPDTADRLQRDFDEMQATMEADPQGEASRSQKLAMLKLVKILAEISYGHPSEDGEVFDKSEGESFKHSAKYDAFRIFLFENPKELEAFISTILNNEVIAEFSGRIHSGAQPAELGATGPTKGNLSREEVLENMKKLGIKAAE